MVSQQSFYICCHLCQVYKKDSLFFGLIICLHVVVNFRGMHQQLKLAEYKLHPLRILASYSYIYVQSPIASFNVTKKRINFVEQSRRLYDHAALLMEPYPAIASYNRTTYLLYIQTYIHYFKYSSR